MALGSKKEKKRVKFAFRCVKREEFYIEPALDPGQKLKIGRKNILTRGKKCNNLW